MEKRLTRKKLVKFIRLAWPAHQIWTTKGPLEASGAFVRVSRRNPRWFLDATLPRANGERVRVQANGRTLRRAARRLVRAAIEAGAGPMSHRAGSP